MIFSNSDLRSAKRALSDEDFSVTDSSFSMSSSRSAVELNQCKNGTSLEGKLYLEYLS
jgi:hypothetical protein